ncbi:hypothetical protein ACFXPW_33340 [Streptomyces goshikiensis]|uniref:hypothetical protein n=1 Tax=Streptomyces goshikiensis TaxID=1942 RepID=UPI003681CAF8
MIRLASSHAAITAPLVTSIDTFPGIPIGRSTLDRRAFHLSPVLVDDKLLPSTNCLALGGLGSGKSATDKACMLREIRDHQHQGVVIDSFGESKGGEWGPLTAAVGGQVIKAGDFRINPCSTLLPPEVREELIRSLIAAVEPRALTTQSAHALQHALQHPKATNLNGVVDALVSPLDGTWSATKLAGWGEDAAIALSRYTGGSLVGLFDGEQAMLPPTDLPLITFDFSGLDRNSPAIPALMAAVSVWVEHVWLPQSTAVHRHLVLEEAWQILRDPATTELIQRLLKNSRKLGLSIKALMHTLSDLGDGRAQDLARLCEVAHIGRLAPKEAAIVGALMGLPDWAIAEIPSLAPGEAVWRVGPHHVDIVKTVLSEEEARLTDTSVRRRQAQQITADPTGPEEEAEEETWDEAELACEPEGFHVDSADYVLAPAAQGSRGEDAGWDFDMPPTVIDSRHYEAVQAARDGRFNEASELAVLGEAQDIRSYGINSDEALSWLSTRAVVADLGGRPDKATELRATVIRMGKDVEWWDKEPVNSPPQAEHYGPLPPVPVPDPEGGKGAGQRRRTWLYVAVVAALTLTTAGVWHKAEADKKDEARQQKVAAYKGRSGASLMVDDVNADVIARWTKDRDRIIIELSAPFDPAAKLLRIEAAGKSVVSTRADDRYMGGPELELPVSDPLADVTVQIEIGGTTWHEGATGTVRTVRLSPTGIAYDAETGERLPRN